MCPPFVTEENIPCTSKKHRGSNEENIPSYIGVCLLDLYPKRAKKMYPSSVRYAVFMGMFFPRMITSLRTPFVYTPFGALCCTEPFMKHALSWSTVFG